MPRLSENLCFRSRADTFNMPSRTEGLVLTVDPHVLHKVDTENPENFFSIWACK